MKKQKKISLLIPLLLLFPLLGNAEIVTNTLQLRTNLISICLVTNATPESSAATNSGALVYEPIFSDKDFVWWNLRDHTFTVTPQAAIRLLDHETFQFFGFGEGTRFAVVCSGEPIYSGQFKSRASSSSCPDPVIIPDLALPDCFGGVSKVPEEIWQAVRANDRKLTDRLLAMTNKLSNVTFSIDRGYPGDENGGGPDRRNDPEIISAVEKLFGRKQPLPAPSENIIRINLEDFAQGPSTNPPFWFDGYRRQQ